LSSKSLITFLASEAMLDFASNQAISAFNPERESLLI